jgi:hypothetical protein
LPIGYFHVVFTLPAEIGTIAYANKAVVYDLLFRTAADTLLTIAADPKHLGAKLGVTAVLHSWGSAMCHHPHVHMIVPPRAQGARRFSREGRSPSAIGGGGLSADGTAWVASRPNFLVPVRVLSRLFRRRFLDGLAALHGQGRLAFFGEHAQLADDRAVQRQPP